LLLIIALSKGRHRSLRFGWLRIERLAPSEHANRLIVTPRISGEDIDRFSPTLTDRTIGREGWTSSNTVIGNWRGALGKTDHG
jgi:hypothetical protein